MPNSRFYSSIAAVTNLQVTANPGDVSIQVASSIGWPNSFPFTLSLDYGSANEELVDVTAGGPSIFTVTRAVDGTSATTHNAGAVVRHVSSARDFTDSRTHEASSTGVHGTTGAIADTASTQTLSNKTLNAPVINGGSITGTVTNSGTISGGTLSAPAVTNPTISGGGSLAGTFSGTPTYSGVPTFSAGSISEGILSRKPNGTDLAVSVGRDADTQARLNVTADGAMTWGPGGTTANDTGPLQRTNAGILGYTGAMNISGGLSVGSFSTGGTAAMGDINITNQTWTSFTPTWNGSNASMSTNVGYYAKVGKIVHYIIYTVFSSSSSLTGGLSILLPTTPYRGSSPLIRQMAGTFWYTDVGPGSGSTWQDTTGMGLVPVFAGDSGQTTGVLRNYKGEGLTGGLLVGPSPASTITVQGWYREA